MRQIKASIFVLAQPGQKLVVSFRVKMELASCVGAKWKHLNSMEPSEIEFLAENVRVSIVPNFNEGALFLMEGDVGPFRAGMPTSVPLWMAADLRSRKKCRIVQPVFLNPEKLEEVRDAERDSQFFTEMPHPQLFVIAQLLLDVATQDLVNADKIKIVLKDIWDIRQAKLRKSVDAFVQSGMQHAKLDHLQRIELNSVRPLLPLTLDHVHRLEVAAASIRPAGDSSFSNSFL